MLYRVIIVPNKETTLEAMFWLGRINLQETHTRKSADLSKTVLEVACYPGKDKRLSNNLHALLLSKKNAQGSYEEIKEIICPSAESAEYEKAVSIQRNPELKDYEITVNTIDYIKDTKKDTMLYSSRKVLMQDLEREFKARGKK